MKAEITKVAQIPSRYGNKVFLITLKGDEKSFRTWVDPKNRNFSAWQPYIEKFRSGQRVILDGLMPKGRDLIDADSQVKSISMN